MDQDNNKKIITLSYVAAAAVVWLVAGILLNTAAATFGAVARLMDMDVFRHGVPFALALGTFLALQFNAKVVTYTDEVVTEISKVVWPSKPETVAMTIVVCVMLLISAGLLAAFDLVSGYLVNYLIKS